MPSAAGGSLFFLGFSPPKPKKKKEGGGGAPKKKQTHLSKVGHIPATGGQTLSRPGMAAKIPGRSKDQKSYSESHVPALRESHALGIDPPGTQPHWLSRTQGGQQTPKTASDFDRRGVCGSAQSARPSLSLYGPSGWVHRPSCERGDGPTLEWDRLRKPSHGSQGRIRSQPSHEAKIGVFPGRIAAGSGCRNRFARMEAALPRDRRRLVFPSPRTNEPYDSGSLRKKVLKAAAVRAKIRGPIGWHSLRHSYRAWLDETGAPLGVQQKLMRHASIATTMNIYGG